MTLQLPQCFFCLSNALDELIKEVEAREKRRRDQAAKGLDTIGYFVLCKLTDDGIKNPDTASSNVAEGVAKFPNWPQSEGELRELCKQVTLLFCEKRQCRENHGDCGCSIYVALEELPGMKRWH